MVHLRLMPVPVAVVLLVKEPLSGLPVDVVVVAAVDPVWMWDRCSAVQVLAVVAPQVWVMVQAVVLAAMSILM